MRLPWLQIDADGQTRARMLARLLGVPEPQGLGIALALWTWALEMAPDGDFSGAVEGDAELVAAAVSWPIERAAELIAQLQRVGFMATAPALRVRGLERYRRTWEKNRRKGHGKDNSADSGSPVPGPARVPPVSRQNPARKTETETENLPLPSVEVRQPPAPKVEKPPGDPRHAPLVKSLVAVFEATGAKYPFTPRDAKAVTQLLALAEPDAIAAAWSRALRHPGFPTVRTLAELVTHFAHFVGAAPPTQRTFVRDPITPVVRPEGKVRI
jgi:hypothetical protein